MGDYLDVNGKNRLGMELRSVCGIGGPFRLSSSIQFVNISLDQEVAFSSRAQLLISKFGRSSKPAPRFLVVVRPFSHGMLA